MLTKRIVGFFSRFTRPQINQYENIFQLMNDKSISLDLINKLNKHTQQKTKDKPFYDFQHILKFNPQIIQSTLNKQIQIQAYTPISHKKYSIKKNMVTGQWKYDFLPEDIQNPFSTDAKYIRSHYSLKNRQVPVIQQYQLNQNNIILFNLPDNATEKDIFLKLPKLKINNIKIGYCLYGLPSYAKIQFENSQQTSKFLNFNKDYIELGQKYCYFYSQADQQRLNLSNRMLVVKGVNNNNTQTLFTQLSKYGKITYFDHPQFIQKGITLQLAKQIFKNQPNRVKLNYYKKDGTIESQFYPPYEEDPLIQPFKQAFSRNFQKKADDLQSQFEERNKRKLKFSQNINIYEERIGKIQIVPQDFVIVAFSCPDQAQNCYFGLKNNKRIQLVKDKYQFNFDKPFKQRLLRYIDNQFLTKRVEQKQDKVNMQKNFIYLTQSLIDQLRYEQFVQVGKKDVLNLSHGQHYSWLIYQNTLEKLKNQVGKRKKDGKSFDQLAEMQLYGRMLPKYDKKRTFQLQNFDAKKRISHWDLQNPSQKKMARSDKVIKKEFIAFKRKHRIQESFEKGIQGQKIDGEQSSQGNNNNATQSKQFQQQQIDQPDYDGKRHFSTFKAKRNYRNMTWNQIAHKNLKFNQFIKDTINQYLGIFSEQKLESNFSYDQTKLINPHRVKFSDGKQFLTQQDIPRILQFHRNPEQASSNFKSHVITTQIVQSKQTDVDQLIFGNIDKNGFDQIIDLVDRGVVQQIFQFDQQGTNIDQVILNLNAVQAKYGEQFRKVRKDDKDFIVKIKKMEHIYPLDKVKNIQNFMKQQQSLIQIDKLELIKKHFEEIITTGKIPQQLKQAFGQERDQVDFDQLFSQIGSSHGIWKKDAQMFQNLSKYTQEDIQNDINMQIQAEKIRSRVRSVNQDDYSKDPDNIDVTQENGDYAVSKFKQI